MKTLSREHQAVYYFKNSMAQLRSALTDEESIMYTRFFDAFDGAISDFIQTELNIRQGERYKVLNINPDLEAYSIRYGEKLNKQGIEMTKLALGFLKEFKKTLGEQPKTDKEFQVKLNEYHTDLKETLALVELKASDVKEVNKEMENVLKSLKPGNTGLDLISDIEKNLEKLIKVRSTPGRGAETNIAVWKLIAAATMLGIGAWIVYKCYYSPWRCSQNEKKIYNTILFLAIATFAACE